MVKSIRSNIIAFVFLGLLTVSVSLAQENEKNYIFERMWPTLQQPWYFNKPMDVATDKYGYVYIADSGNYSIQKFTRDGQLVSKWKIEARENGLTPDIAGITVDSNSFVYITDTYGIQKFNTDGRFEKKWLYEEGEGKEGFSVAPGIAVDENFVYVFISEKRQIKKFSTEGKFVKEWSLESSGEQISERDSYYSDVAVDNKGFVYLADTDTHCVQKITTEGKFETKWSLKSEDDGTAALPSGIAVDRDGFVYVTDAANRNILKFNSKGEPIENWRDDNSGKEYFFDIAGMTVNQEGVIYVADWNYHCIHKLNSDTGDFIVKWGSFGNGDGEFHRPFGIALDSNNKHIYVADTLNNRIQKFSTEGGFEGKWESWKNASGQEDRFNSPYGMAVDSHGFVYVADMNNNRVLKFDPDGNFRKWTSSDIDKKGFLKPSDVAVDENDAIYVADTDNHLIWKFNPDGSFNQRWEGFKEKFSKPFGIAVYNGSIYVTDTQNDHIQKLDADGNAEMWGSYCNENQQFTVLTGITVDSKGYIYVSDTWNHCIQKFQPDGTFVTSFGRKGTLLGELNSPSYLCVDTNDKVYVADTLNNRIQVFKLFDPTEGISKAIIIAGGGPYEGNHLWDATRMNANFAYRTLNYQGFGKNDIYYLTSDTELDLDGDGERDTAKYLNNNDKEEVNGAATKENFYTILSYISESSQEEDINDLVLYLVDHGGEKIFRMNETQTCSVSELKSKLEEVAKKISGKIFIIYDACESGTFHSDLESLSDGKHILITSTSGKENAYFMAQGSVSFSNLFWTNIFNGDCVRDAFQQARNAVKKATESKQEPRVSPSYSNLEKDISIGTGVQMNWMGPKIDMPSEYRVNGSSASLHAQVIDNDGDNIDHVWAIIIPPFGNVSDNSVLEMPSIDLMPDGTTVNYKAVYDKFNIKGTYLVVIHARDSKGNTSVSEPVKVSVGEPMIRRAIIAAGSDAVEKNIKAAYDALKMQYYTDDSIYLMAPETFLADVETRLTTRANLLYALEQWTDETTYDLVVYMTGKGEIGKFQINENETLTAVELDNWLDKLQDSIPGMVTVIYDADYSGSFIPLLAPSEKKNRIIVSGSGANQKALQNGVSFSTFFWKEVSNGLSVRDAFLNAGNALKPFFSGERRMMPQMDDNGNRVANERSDGKIAGNYTIGAGIRTVGDEILAAKTDNIVPKNCNPFFRSKKMEILIG